MEGTVFLVIYNVRVNDKCLDLRLLVGQKNQFEYITLGSGKL